MAAELEPLEPAFENYYPQNYEAAEGGMFVGLKPLGDLDAKTLRGCGTETSAPCRARGRRRTSPGPLALIVAQDGLRFVGPGTILAGRAMCGAFSFQRRDDVTLVTGRLDMFVTEPRGTPVAAKACA